MQISHGLALIKLNWKKLLAKQKHAARIIFNQDRFTHTCPLLKTLNAPNIYQRNLLQVLLFMQKIKTNSSSRIFLHHFQTVNHKHATWYPKNNSKEPKRPTNYAILHSSARSSYLEQLFKWNWKKTYHGSISLNVKSKKKYLNLKNWASFKP